MAAYTTEVEAQYAREAERLAKSNQKAATAQLASLKKESDKKRREVASLSTQTQKARKTKGAMEEVCAQELNARAACIGDLSRIVILAGALGQTQTQRNAMDEMAKQARAYNATLRLLPKATRAGIQELPRNFVQNVVNGGVLPVVPTFRIDEDQRPIEMITFDTTPDALSIALASSGRSAERSEILLSGAAPARMASSIATPATTPVSATPTQAPVAQAEAPKPSRRITRDERAMAAYTTEVEAQYAREVERTARQDRKAALTQLATLEKETTKLRREVQSASAAYRQAKTKKTSLSAPLARELNARSELVMTLSRSLLIANALGEQKQVKKFTSALRSEAQAYNTTLRSLPKEQRKLAVPMDKNPGARILAEGVLPSLMLIRVEEPEAEFAIIPSPTESRTVRQATEVASAVATPDEFYIPSHATVASASSRLTRKEATKQMRTLEAQSTEARRRLANAEATRLTERRAKQSTTASTVDSLNARAEIIEVNARMLALAKSQGQKQAEKRAIRAIDTEVRTYNADARALSKSERIKIAPLPEKLSQSIAQGVPMSSIARIRMDSTGATPAEVTPASIVEGGAEDIVITRSVGDSRQAQRRSATSGAATPTERPARLYSTTTTAYDNKQITEYLSKQQKSVSALKKERTKEERRTSSLTGNERIDSILRVRNMTARIIATEIDTIEVLRTESSFRREMTRVKSELTEEVRRYNRTGEDYKKVTGRKLTPLNTKLASRVARGAEYEPPRIADATEESFSITPSALASTAETALATESVYENLGRRERAVSRAQRRARSEEYMRVEAQSRQARELSMYEGAEAIATTRSTLTRDYAQIEAMDRHEYRAYLKAGEKQIRTLQKQIGSYEKQNKKAKENDTHAALVGAIVALERELCETYFSILKTGVATGTAHDKKKYTRLAKNEILTYNRRLRELTRYTGTKYPQADTSIPDKIVNRKAYNPMPAVACELDPTTQLRREQELRRVQQERAQRQARIDGVLRTKQQRKTQKKVKTQTAAEDQAPLSKSELEKYKQLNISVIIARFDEEIFKLEREVIELERQHTVEPKKIKKEIEKRKLHMRQLKMEKNDALRDERRENARHFALLSVPPRKLVSRRMTLENAMAYQEDLMQLMRERIALNERILALYRGVSDGSDAQAIRVEKMYLAAHEKALKRYNRLAAKIRKLHITIPQKEQLFALINQCAREQATIEVEQKKISMFKLRGAALKVQKENIRKAKESLRRTKAEIERKMNIRVAQDQRFLRPEHYAVWFFALLALAIVGFMVWVFRIPLWEFFKSIMTNITG